MDDPLFTLAAAFPFGLGLAGLAFVWRAARASLPADIQAEVLAAMSDKEAMSVSSICDRLAHADSATVGSALEDLRRSGRAVRWYAPDRSVVYRRVA